MKSKTKKGYLIITILLACVFCIVGLFFAFRSDEKKTLSANAVSSDSENFYFASGAAIQTDTLELRMRFTLKVNETMMTDGDDTIRFTIVDGASNENIQFVNQAKTIVFEETDFNIFFNNGVATVYVALSVDYDTSVSIKAEMLRDGTVVSTAYSDARTYAYIYDKATSGGTASLHTWGEELRQFNATVDKTSLSIHDEYWLDSYNGVSLIVNVPQNYLDSIKQGEVQVVNGAGRKVYEKYKLVFMTNYSYPNLTDTTYNGPAFREYNEVPSCFMDGQTTAILSVGGCWYNGAYLYLGFIKETREVTAQRVVEYRGQTIYGDWATTYTSTAVDWSNIAVEMNVSERAQEILSISDMSLPESEMAWLQDLGGIQADTEEVVVYLKYQYLQNPNNPSTIAWKTDEYFNVKSVYAFSRSFVLGKMYQLKDYTSIADFNVVYKGQYYEDKYVYNTGNRILLQAKDYTYEYDTSTQTGTLTVTYHDYLYKDFGMRIANNNPDNPLELVYYPDAGDITEDQTGKITMVFDYAKIQENLYNSALWLFDLESDDISVSNIPQLNPFKKAVTVTKYDDYLTVTAESQEYLRGVELTATAEIIPDFECEVNYEYVALSVNGRGELVEEVKASEPVTMMNSEYNRKGFENFMIDYGDIVNGALECSAITGTYMTPIDVEPRKNDDGTFTYVVEYKYNTLFKITNTYDNTVLYKALNDVSSLYYGEFFVDTIPTGWRVKAINAFNDDVRITVAESAPDDYTKTKIEVLVDANEQYLIPIEVDMTDKWEIKINHFETYKNTCFAVKTETVKEIRVLDYPDIYALSKTDLAKILGKDDMTVCGMVDVDKIAVTFDKVKYTVDVSYGVASVRSIDYDGNNKEIRVPLTSYVEWCKDFGQDDWSILYLNTETTRYFEYSTDVERDKLYGFFAFATFKEQVSDFNYYFKNSSGAGQITIFDKREVKGSAIYKFCDRMRGKADLLSALVGHFCMAWCEIFDDDNAIYHSYFFYVDGTSANPFITNGRADNAFDNDSAFENTMQDTGDWFSNAGKDVGDWFKNLWQKFRASNWDTVVFVVLGVAGGLLVIGLGWKWGKRYYLWVTAKPKTAPKKSTSKKKTTAKGKKK